MLEVAHVDSFYGETQALFDVSLAVGAGEVVALLGANGAGKTTTLRSILGLTRARAGAIRPTAVLPGDTRTVIGDYDGPPLAPGKYVVHFSGKFGDTPVERRVDVQVAPPTKH